jgi:hypothetical protein
VLLSDGRVVGKGAELLIPALPALLIPAVGAGAVKVAEGVAGAAPISGVLSGSAVTGVVCAPAENCPTVAAKKNAIRILKLVYPQSFTSVAKADFFSSFIAGLKACSTLTGTQQFWKRSETGIDLRDINHP